VIVVRRGLIWPLLLIVFGSVFLLANFGLIAPFSALAIFNLWPLILILVGVDIAIGRRWPLAALAVDVLVLAAGLALVASQPAYPAWLVIGDSGSARGTGQSQVSVPRGSAQTLSLHLNGGAGAFTVSGGSSQLVEATSDRDDLQLRTSGTERLDVRVDQSSNRGIHVGGTAPARVDVKVASDVTTSFDMNAGAGEFVVDLRDVKLADARINVGAASLRIVLPKATGEVAITVSAGASSVVIEVPEGVDARINTSGALLSVRSENPRVAGNETSGYSGAKDRVTVRVTAGASSVVIR
jgi:hypothetical protein